MKSLLELQVWFNKRSDRERLYLFIIGFVFLYLVYVIVFFRPLSAEKNALEQGIAALRSQEAVINQQIDKINAIDKNHIFLQMIAEQKRLTLQLERMQQQIDNQKPALISEVDLPTMIKKILSQQRDNVMLISLEELPVAPWIPEDAVDKKNMLDAFSGIDQHMLQIEFHNDYLSTIDYLKRLEKISSDVYWDSMDYKVLKYPNADVVIQFHVLSLQKS